MKVLALLIATTIAAGIAVFSASNKEVVKVDFLIGKVSMDLSCALLGAAVLGALLGIVLVVLMRQRTPEKELNVQSRK